MNYLKNNFFKNHFDLFIVVPILIGLLFPLSYNQYISISIIIVIEVILMCLLGYIVLKYKHTALYFLAFLIPLSVQTSVIGSSKINLPSEAICLVLTFYVLVKAAFNLKITKRFIYHPITIVLIIDIVWLVITSSVCQLKDLAFKRTLIRIMYIIVYYYLFNELFKQDIKNIYKVLLIYSLGMIYPIIHSIFFHYQFHFSSQGSVMASRPFYNDHTIYGAAIAFIIPFSIYFLVKSIAEKNKLKMILSNMLLFILLIGVAFSYSRAAWLSLIFALLLFLILKFKIKVKHLISTFIIGMLIIALSWSSIFEYIESNKEISHKNDVSAHFKSVTNVKTDVSNTERLNRWKCAWRMFIDKPVFGFGPGCYQFFYGSYQLRKDMTAISTFKGNKGHAHSEYLNYLSETGLVGMLNFIVLLILTCYFAIKIIYKTRDDFIRSATIFILLGFFTYIIHAFFNGFIETDKIGMLFFVSISSIVALDLKDKSIEFV